MTAHPYTLHKGTRHFRSHIPVTGPGTAVAVGRGLLLAVAAALPFWLLVLIAAATVLR